MISDALIPILQEVYVAGIPEACVEQEFRDFFAQYGNVTSTKLSEQSKNGTSDLFWACVFCATCYQTLRRLQKATMSNDQAFWIIFIYCHGVFLIFVTTCFGVCVRGRSGRDHVGKCQKLLQALLDKCNDMSHHPFRDDYWWLWAAPNQCKTFDGATC